MIRPSTALSSALRLARRSRGRVSRRPYRWAALVLAVLLLGTAVATIYTIAVQRDDQRERLDRDAAVTVQAFDRRLDSYGEVLIALRALFAVDPTPSAARFRRFVRSIQISTRYAAVKAVGFARTETVRGSRLHHAVVTRVEPLAGNEPALGLDLATDPVRRRALDATNRTGRVAATGPVRLVQGPRRRNGFVVMLAVRGPGGQAARPTSGRSLGVVTAAFDMNTLVDVLFGPSRKDFGLEVYDVGESGARRHRPPSRASIIYGAGPAGSAIRSADGRHATLRPVDAAGRRWLVYYAPRGAAAVTIGPNAWIVAVGGTLGSLLAAWLFLTLARGRSRALALAGRMTRELEHSERQTREILETAPDAFVGLDARGAITDWNPQAEAMFGWSRSDMLGKRLTVLLPEHDRPLVEEILVGEAARDSGRLLELSALRRDGHELAIELSIAALHSDRGLTFNAFVRDTSERVQAQRKFEQFVEFAPDAIVGVRQDGAIVLVNAQVEHVFGYTRDELLGRPIEILIPERFHGVHAGHRGGFFADPGTRPMGEGLTLFARRKDGSEFPAEISLSSIETAEGPLATAAVRDITERERMQAELRRSSRYFDLSRDLVCTAGVDGHFRQLNAAWTETLGWSEEELRSRPFVDFVHPDDRENTLRETSKLADGLDTVSFVNRYQTHDGGWRRLEWNSIMAPDEQLIYASARDITERALAEAALATSERQTRQILETAHDAFVSIDSAGRIRDWNSQAEATFGWAGEEVVGRLLDEMIIPAAARDAHRRGLERFLETGEGRVLGRLIELTAIHRDGHEFPVELTISPLLTDDGYLFNAFLRDITERTRTQEQLALAHEQAVQASRMKSDFVANMSHEIRTPLNGIIGLSGLLLGTELDDEQREYAESVQASGDALMAVISDILDFSKIEAGKLELDDHPFELHEVVDGVSAMLAMEAHEKGLDLMVWVDDDVPNEVRGDGPRIRQVLANLATNAVKFTHAGEVVMRITLEPDGASDDDAGCIVVRFSVSDTGIGIDPDTAARIFDSFSQADTSTTREYGGTGLGLAISKQLVELMGGRIGLESAPASGSTFWFTVPVVPAPAGPHSGATRRTNFAEIRVLIVDDSATSRTILEHKLTSWGMSCDSASGHDEALGVLRAAGAAGRPYGLALLDFNMQGMSGLDLARAAQAIPELESTRLMMLSSSGAEREAAAQAGVHGFVTKPVRGSRLAQEIARVLGAGQLVPTVDAASRAASSRRNGAGPDRLVLVAEDKGVNQLVAVRMLEKLGFRADIARNGREAVDMHAGGSYEAIFMDCQMPELDGYQATAEIRRRERSGHHTPIIAMTAHTLRGDRERCLAAGMDDYVGKPIRTADLADVIARALACEVPRGRPVATATATAAVADAEVSLIDATRLNDVFGEDEQARSSLLAQFLTQTRQAIAELAGPIAAGDAPAIARIAHGMKGSASVVGAERLSQLAARMSDDAAAGRLEGVEQLHAELQFAFDATDRALT